MELEVTSGRLIHVWWAMTWRSLVMSLAGGVVGGVIGAVIGALAAVAGLRAAQVIIITLPVGVVIGLIGSLLAVKWLLRSKLGDFRLALVPSTALGVAAAAPSSSAWTVAPGWYPDPSGAGVKRWWNGMRWTDDPGGPVA